MTQKDTAGLLLYFAELSTEINMNPHHTKREEYWPVDTNPVINENLFKSIE